MSKESRMEGVQGTGAGRKAASGSVGMGNGGRGPPPRKESGSAAGAAPGHVVSGAGSSRAPGRHSAVRQTARELERRSAQQPKRPRHPLFDFPPTFELAVSRQFAFFRRVFSPSALFEPLPAPVRLSLERNFGFFTRIFTQFVDPNETKKIQQSLPGIGRRD